MKIPERPEQPERIDDYYFGETVEESIAFVDNPDAWKIIQHLVNEAEKSLKRGDERPEWESLLEMTGLAIEAFSPLDLQRLCWRFFQLGQLTQKLVGLSPEEIDERTNWQVKSEKLVKTAIKTTGNIDLRNAKLKFAKEQAQRIAKEVWAADTEQEYRTGEMAEIVFNELHRALPEEIKKILPKKSAGIKIWIRPISPEYAKKPGR